MEHLSSSKTDDCALMRVWLSLEYQADLLSEKIPTDAGFQSTTVYLYFISKLKTKIVYRICTYRYIEIFGIINQLPVGRRINMIDSKTICRRQIGTQRTMMSGKQYATCSRWLGFIVLIFYINTVLVCFTFQNIRIFVGADASEKYGNIWLLQNPLSHTQRILNRTAGNEIGFIFVDQLFVPAT